MASRLFGRWSNFAEWCNLDPDRVLDLTDGERADMARQAVIVLTEEADKILDQYGCQLLGNGEIIGDADGPGLPDVDSEEWQDLWERMFAIATSLDNVLWDWMNIADLKDAG